MKSVSKDDFTKAEKQLNDLLTFVTVKGGFDFLNENEISNLNKYSQIVTAYEDLNYAIPKVENQV